MVIVNGSNGRCMKNQASGSEVISTPIQTFSGAANAGTLGEKANRPNSLDDDVFPSSG
jgi:hypothetical protein